MVHLRLCLIVQFFFFLELFFELCVKYIQPCFWQGFPEAPETGQNCLVDVLFALASHRKYLSKRRINLSYFSLNNSLDESKRYMILKKAKVGKWCCIYIIELILFLCLVAQNLVVSWCCGWVQSPNDVIQKISKTQNNNFHTTNKGEPTMVSLTPRNSPKTALKCNTPGCQNWNFSQRGLIQTQPKEIGCFHLACEWQTFLLAHRRWVMFCGVPQWQWARRNVCCSQANFPFPCLPTLTCKCHLILSITPSLNFSSASLIFLENLILGSLFFPFWETLRAKFELKSF